MTDTGQTSRGVTDRIARVVVVDDSAYIRKVVRELLGRSPYLEVVGAAHEGSEALDVVERLQPDVVVTDLIMPGTDGVAFIRQQMARRPLPIVVLSIANESSDRVLEALDAGAIDFVHKPTALATEKIYEVAGELIDKVKLAAATPLTTVAPPTAWSPRQTDRVVAPATWKRAFDIVVIGVSTGGPPALKLVVPRLPADFPAPVAIVMHMPAGYMEMYAERLNAMSALRVKEAKEGDAIERGLVLMAPSGHHLVFKRNGSRVVAHLDLRPVDTPHRPSVDALFQSAAETYGDRVLAVVMTGMGADGREGAAWVKAKGGRVMTEAEETCAIYGMPRSVAEAGLTDQVVRLDRIAPVLVESL